MENFTWDDMDFWQSGDWQAAQEKLDDMDKAKQVYCPARVDLFAALDVTPMKDVKVAIIGQDPYPDPRHATGIAFSIPPSLKDFPASLANIFKEYKSDLTLPPPKNGCLKKWCDQGVLLWNAIPTCQAYKSLSHQDWVEWKLLTKEIITRLTDASVLFVFLGGRAREQMEHVDLTKSDVLCFSHPSPRGAHSGTNPFIGSHMFTIINDRLQGEGLTPIDWRL